MKRFILLSMVLFFISVSPGGIFASGQKDFAYSYFTTNQGLPNSRVYSVAQDEDGFLWIGTWDGLSRYDGYEFKNYFHNPSDSSSLCYFSATRVLVDKVNNVWIQGNTFGLSLYDRSTDSFRNFRSKVSFAGISLDRQGNLWQLNQNGSLERWDYQKAQFIKVDVLIDYDRQKIKEFSALEFDNNGNPWLLLLTRNGDLHFLYGDQQQGSKPEFRYLGKILPAGINLQIYNSQNFYWPWKSASGDYWAVSSLGILKLDKSKQVFEKFNGFVPTEELNDVPAAYQSKLKLAVDLFEQNASTEPGILNSAYLEFLFEDRQGTIWTSWFNEQLEQMGMVRAIPVPQRFSYYFTAGDQMHQNAIFPLKKDRFGNLWAGSQTTKWLFMQSPGGEASRFLSPFCTPKDDNHPRALYEDSAGMWIGYYQHDLYFYNFRTKTFQLKFHKTTPDDATDLPDKYNQILRDGGDLLLCGFTSIHRYNPRSEEIELVYKSDDGNSFYVVFGDVDGTWWLGVSKGRLQHLDSNFGLIHEYVFGQGLFNIEAIVPDDDAHFWVATLGGGFAHFNKNSGKLQIYTTANGLSNNTCYNILKDKSGNLWISTNHGISRFTPRTGQFRNFGATDGLTIDEFDANAAFKSPDGRMYFGGVGGVVSFDPEKINQEVQEFKPAPLVITDFKVSGIPRYFRKAVYEMDTVHLQKGDDNFQVIFSALDYRNAEKIKYRYRLLNQSELFTGTDFRNRFVSYSNLKPGKYRFEAESSDPEGNWVSRCALVVVIPPFLYQTIGFRLALILLVLAVAGQIIYSYNHRIRLKARQQQEELRLESLRGQMNPHFIFNSLNSINYFISQNDRLSANRYIADFSRLIRSILGNMSNEYIPLGKELESLEDYLRLEHLRFGNKFDYAVKIPSDLMSESLLVSPGMVQPFVENAIWHGVRGLEDRKGFVQVEFSVAGNALKCVVTDDGIGRNLSNERQSRIPGKTSRGIDMVQERLNIVNRLRKTNFRIQIDDLFADREETGTRVEIDIPVK